MLIRLKKKKKFLLSLYTNLEEDFIGPSLYINFKTYLIAPYLVGGRLYGSFLSPKKVLWLHPKVRGKSYEAYVN